MNDGLSLSSSKCSSKTVKYQKVTDFLEELDSTKEQALTRIEEVQYLFTEIEENINDSLLNNRSWIESTIEFAKTVSNNSHSKKEELKAKIASLVNKISQHSESENLEEQYKNNVKKWQQNADDCLSFISLIKAQALKDQEKNEIQLKALNQMVPKMPKLSFKMDEALTAVMESTHKIDECLEEFENNSYIKSQTVTNQLDIIQEMVHNLSLKIQSGKKQHREFKTSQSTATQNLYEQLNNLKGRVSQTPGIFQEYRTLTPKVEYVKEIDHIIEEFEGTVKSFKDKEKIDEPCIKNYDIKEESLEAIEHLEVVNMEQQINNIKNEAEQLEEQFRKSLSKGVCCEEFLVNLEKLVEFKLNGHQKDIAQLNTNEQDIVYLSADKRSNKRGNIFVPPKGNKKSKLPLGK